LAHDLVRAVQRLGVGGVDRKIVADPGVDEGGLRADHARYSVSTSELSAFRDIDCALHTDPQNA
jgi:hypothetical protein